MNTVKTNIPRHVAIIMDGNRRWAKARGLHVLAGHKHVTDKILEPLIEHAAKIGISYITFWAWSTDNWERSMKEVSGIMRLFRQVIKRNWKKLDEKGVRIRIIGDISQFDLDIKQGLKDVMLKTQENKKITAVFALNYGGRDEIIRAINHLQRNINIDKNELSNCLDTSGIPDPDIIVRTGGEQRLSGFMLWQSEYSELYFPAWYMPDFTPEKLEEVIIEYRQRIRRYGK